VKSVRVEDGGTVKLKKCIISGNITANIDPVPDVRSQNGISHAARYAKCAYALTVAERSAITRFTI
jgi:hypothetical protein